ncbi:MAG TPA: NAD(P)H-hydrate epimerase [Phycisphaerae bacterium]|nr:NAD(P)H-hydrate epimerase [Phycisphaerae bacterium]
MTRDQCRAADRYAIEQLGIPGVVLMENAGRNAADVIERCLRRRAKREGKGGAVAVVCGKGNNGGDGFVIARHLSLRGYDVGIDLLAAPADLTGDAAINFAVAARMNIPIRRLDKPRALSQAARRWRRCAAVVDALLGTGFSGEVRGPMAEAIRHINALEGPTIVAADVPSGLNADTGVPGGEAVRADVTVTFLAAKIGLVNTSARPYVGRLVVVDIGAPLEAIRKRLGIRARNPR